jgi:ketosteroid isomerase-like protein
MRSLRSSFLVWPVLVVTASLALAQGAPAPDAQKLVDNERAFAADVAAHGVREGFLRWLAPTGIVFGPGPVNAIKFYKAQKPKPTRLTWYANKAVMSASGDMGWTTGPWDWRSDSTKTKAEATGDFVTVWRRQGDGSWKAAFDGGVSRTVMPTEAEPALSVLPPGPRGGGPLARRRSLYQTDTDYATLVGQEGVSAAIAKYAADDCIVLRDDMPRLTNASVARDSLLREGAFVGMSLGQFIADAGDLGYTFGSRVRSSAAGPDSSYYLHIWQRGRARPWELALEYVQPVPRRK